MEEKNQGSYLQGKETLEFSHLPLSDKILCHDVMVKSLASGVR